MKVPILLIPNVVIIRVIKHNLNYTKNLTIAVGMLAIAAGMIGTIVLPGYLQEVKAVTKYTVNLWIPHAMEKQMSPGRR